MIKAGAYGIFRSLTAIFRPSLGYELAAAWQHSAAFGLIVLWLGLLTMLVGVVLALKQHDAKRLLAYHSISQMGFVLAGLGAAGYLGLNGAQGQAGGLLHIVNHGLFKAALFLGVGAVALRTGERNLYKLGGLWQQMPLTFIFMLVAAAGIAGIPLFNGFVSKSLIHQALVEAHPMLPWRFAEVVLIVTSGGTVASFIKLISLTFLGRPKREAVRDAPPRMLLALGLLAIPIILLGLRPDAALGAIVVGLSAWGISAPGIDTFLQQYFLSGSDLQKAGVSTGLGILIYLAVVKIKLFRWPFLSHASSTLARSINAAMRKVSPSWWSLPQPDPSQALPSRTLLTSLEQLLMRWDHAGALWLAFGALLILAMLGGRGG
jgi:formate hydrogenlyase subunit 3/multisubunit Na+/H+ antiporter MnhD subunit